MKKINLYPLTIVIIAITGIFFLNSCGKTSTVAPVVKSTGTGTTTTTGTTGPQIIYSLDDTLYNTPTQIWSIGTDGTGKQQIAIKVPANLHFEFNSDIAAEVSTDNKSMVLSLETSDESVTYFYKCNIDGSGVQQIPNVSGYLYLQTYINASSILYWKNADNGHNGELWKVNTDGTGNQKINISLPTGVALGDGKFAKVTADGKTIIFSTFGVNGSPSYLLECNIDGSGLKPVISDYLLNMQALVNNTTALADLYNGPADEGGLFLVNLDGSGNHLVLGPNNFPLGLTPGDSRVVVINNSVFVVTEDVHGIQAIYSANTDGTNIKLVTNVPAGFAVKLQGVVQ